LPERQFATKEWMAKTKPSNATRDSHGSERVCCHEFQGSVYGVTLGYIQKLFAACFLTKQ
jgi:hypothetical protein